MKTCVHTCSYCNCKILNYCRFEDPHAKLKLTPRLVSRRSTMRKSIAGTGSPVKSARSWKKPPKKRDSIRKLSRQSTARALQRGQSSTASASTVVLSGTSDVNSSSHTDAPLCTPVQKWRKPPKKQSTIRRLALSNSQSIRGSTRRPALAKQDTLLLSADQTFAQTPLNSSMEMMPVLSNKRDSTRLRQKRDKKDFLSQDTVEMPSLSFYGEESPPKQPKHAKKRGKR